MTDLNRKLIISNVFFVLTNHTNFVHHRRTELVDLEAEFKPSLLNSAVYLLQLIQQISTFAVNYQGRPFRESLTENKGMFYGIVAVAGIAFSCATEFVPELNSYMTLVPFSDEFKTTLTAVMALDYAACWAIEVVLKKLFSDYRPRDIAVRRQDQLEREFVRREAEQKKKDAEQERKRLEKVAEFERKIDAQRQRLQGMRQ